LTVEPPYTTTSPVLIIVITDPGQPPEITATPCFNTLCQRCCAQWYTWLYGIIKIPIPGATGLSYQFDNPVTYDFLGTGQFSVEVFDPDEGGIPHEVFFYVSGSW
jgi:hypothetical protein